MSTGTTLLARPPTGCARGLTRLELLVAVSVVLLVAGLGIFVLTHKRDDSPRCLDQLRKIGFAYQSYLKDYNLWMPCAGNDLKQMYDVMALGKDSYKPTYELPWWLPAWSENAAFPYWYEVFQPYCDPSATTAAAIASYNARMDAMNPPKPHLNTMNPQPALRVEQARLMGIFTCPAKPDAVIGYGYNYTAPFGNTACYPNNRDKFAWKDMNGKEYPSPVNYEGQPVAIQILWWGQSVHSSIITGPSTQVGWVDTGRITENPDSLDSRLWKESSESNDQGYVRFPLMKFYWPANPANGSSGGLVAQYKASAYAWRPVGRHGGKANCLKFDGSAVSVTIGDLCSPSVQWGDAGCLFDNKPPNKPGASPIFGSGQGLRGTEASGENGPQ